MNNKNPFNYKSEFCLTHKAKAFITSWEYLFLYRIHKMVVSAAAATAADDDDIIKLILKDRPCIIIIMQKLLILFIQKKELHRIYNKRGMMHSIHEKEKQKPFHNK